MRCLGAFAAIAATWMIVLPRIGAHPSVAEHVELQQRLGVDPAAMFYSELKIVPAIAHRVEQLNRAHRSAFWSWPDGLWETSAENVAGASGDAPQRRE